MRITTALCLAAVVGGGSIASASTILIDLGISTSPVSDLDSVGRTWNSVDDDHQNLYATNAALVYSTGASSGVHLAIASLAGSGTEQGFNSTNSANTNGITAAAAGSELAARNYPANALRDSMYGNSGDWPAGGALNTTTLVRMTLSGLDDSQVYKFYFFASRTSVSDNRETLYVVDGAGDAKSVTLDAANNTSRVATVADIAPEGGTITIDVSAGPNNNNSTGFFYLGVLEIESAPVPEVSTVSILAAAGAGLLRRQKRS